jgi:sugar phosphate permease
MLGCLGLAATLLLYLQIGRAGAAANFAGMALVGFFLFGPDALISAAAAQDAGGRAGTSTAAGWINGMGSIGAVFQGVLTAEVSRRLGWDALFVLFVALSLLAALALLPRALAERGAAAPAVS